MVNFVFLMSGIFCFLFFLSFSALSLFEKEYLASRRSLIAGIIISAPIIFLSQINFLYKNEFQLGFLLLVLIGIIVITLPFNLKKTPDSGNPKNKIDERDIMFSRNELAKGTENFNNYYENNPDKLSIDEEFRKQPGLLDEKSFYHNRLMASSAKASFEVVDLLTPGITGKVSDNREDFDKNRITNYIKTWTKKLGAIDVGITELKDYHFYSVAGRKTNYGKDVHNKHKYAIAFTVEMDYDMVKGGPSYPIVMESSQQYQNAGQIAVQLGAFIRNLGYDARAHIDGNYQVVCPLVAKDAGLGEIGRMGLLMTTKLGPRVRLGVVTTDITLNIDKPIIDHSVIDFCNKCKKCADCCPSSAIQSGDREDVGGIFRWQINSEACFTYWCKVGSDCGRCVVVCPYSHPNNFLHNVIRWGIGRNSVFRSFALLMDDFFYGKKPKANRIPNWLNN
jgi:reductive dehalogenase